MDNLSSNPTDLSWQEFIQRIKSKTLENISSKELNQFELKINSALKQNIASPQRALSWLEKILLENKLSIKFILENERLLKVLRLFGYSGFFAQKALQNSELFKDAILWSEKQRNLQDIQKDLEECLKGVKDFDELSQALRLFRLREHFRLALLNLDPNRVLETETKELSFLAEAILEFAIKKLYQLANAGKIPALGKDIVPLDFCVLALGKLGSFELNFWSDIDLIYICPDIDPKRNIQLQDYFQLAQILGKLISEQTSLGTVFKIDLDLRPAGKSGPLVNPYSSALDYYYNFGRAWERLALIRARPIAGNKSLGEKFLKELEGFIFRKYYDFSSLEDLKEIKRKIDLEAKKHRPKENYAGFNIKLGIGGIREIEFFIHTLQLIYGGRQRDLRIKGTIQALNKLCELGLVDEKDAEVLRDAWDFLRKVEHRIQMKELRQEHRLPQDPLAQKELARSFGFLGENPWQEFHQLLKRHTDAVARIFNRLFGEEQEEKNKFIIFFDRQLSLERLEKEFSNLGFSDPELAVEHWERLLNLSDKTERETKLWRTTLPLLLEEISKSPEPDLCLLQLERFLSRTPARTGYLALLKDSQRVRSLLIHLFSQSEFLSNIFITHPEFLDELLSEESLRQRTPSELEAELEKEVMAGEDFEDKLRRLRRFQKLELIRLGLKDLTGELSQQELEKRLSLLAELVLEQAYKISWEEVAKKYGVPAPDEQGERAGILIVALGRLGSKEMNWASDLDLIFIYQGQGSTTGPKKITVGEFFVRLAQKLISTLEAQTPEGYLYKIDTRLRPSGRFGPLVVSADAFLKYHQSQAQVWEKQSLLKARILIDGIGIRNEFQSQLEKLIFSDNNPQYIKTEMRKLLAKTQAKLARENENQYDIKFGLGGELELEYIVQYFQLCFGEKFHKLRVQNTWQALSQLKELKLISDYEAQALHQALTLYRRLASRLRIYKNRSEQRVIMDDEFLNKLAKKLQIAEIHSASQLRAQLERSRQDVHSILEKYLGE